MVKVSDRGEPIEPVHLNNLLMGIKGWGVTSGLGVTERDAGPNLSVDVGIGNTIINATAVTKAATTNVVITAADASFERFDLVVINSSGTVSVIAGTAAATAFANDYDLEANNAILLAEVSVPATDTTISDSQITDKRAFIELLANTTDGHEHDGVDSKTLLPTIISDTYTGNASTSQEVDTGLAALAGVLIVRNQSGGPFTAVLKTDEHTGTNSTDLNDGTFITTRFAGPHSGGSFFVDDNGADGHPNTNGIVYAYIAWGIAS